ncbi:hypothetical protein N24_2741 [Corynebacterium suranareeae]|uniref:Uncharacterized protein n=1 Tax=Corynebacterium suranareeae TaxID=2506452 RepID=A0A160PUG1_9CORY|nr:hypothetical protein N24_2741 [Corynebacterium suranareeae]
MSAKPAVWNLVGISVFGTASLAAILDFQKENPDSWAFGMCGIVTVIAIAWGLCNYKKSPRWLLPRVYAGIATPTVISFLLANSGGSFWLSLSWLVFFPILLSVWLGSWDQGKSDT